MSIQTKIAKSFLQFEITINVFPFHLNTFGIHLRPLEQIYSFSVGIDFRSQDLMYMDVIM